MNRFVVANARRQRVPITIVGGPRGAGKTTLLRQLLTCNDGRRIAVALDRGVVPPPSAALATNASRNPLDLPNGSSCLALDGDIGTALSTLHSTRDRVLPDHVVVEASATADPLRMAGYTFLPGFRPGGVIVVVSGPDIEEIHEEGREPDSSFAAQLRHAELLILNHMDQLRGPKLPAVRRWLQDRAPRARLIESRHCCVPTVMILGADRDHLPGNAIQAEWSPSLSVSAESRKQRVLQPRHSDDYRSWLLRANEPIDQRGFRHWVRTLPDSIVRGDGVLRILGEPSHQFRFECCGQRWSLSRDEPWRPNATPASWISLVGFASRSSGDAQPRAESDAAAAHGRRQPKRHFRPPLWASPSAPSFGDPE